MAIGLFLFWTQRTLFGDAFALLATVAGGLAAMLRVLSGFEARASKKG